MIFSFSSQDSCQETTVGESVSTLVSMKPLNIFDKTSGQFTAVYLVTETGEPKLDIIPILAARDHWLGQDVNTCKRETTGDFPRDVRIILHLCLWPETTVQDCVAALVSVKPLDIFHEASGHL